MSTTPRPRSCWPRKTTRRARSSRTTCARTATGCCVAADRAKALALLGDGTSRPDRGRRQRGDARAARRGPLRRGIAGRADPDTPMIVLSRDADRLQRIRLLERGGDDVVEEAVRLPGAARPDRRGAAPVARDPAAAGGSCAPGRS